MEQISSNAKPRGNLVNQIHNTKPGRTGSGTWKGTHSVPALDQMLASQHSCRIRLLLSVLQMMAHSTCSCAQHGAVRGPAFLPVHRTPKTGCPTSCRLLHCPSLGLLPTLYHPKPGGCWMPVVYLPYPDPWSFCEPLTRADFPAHTFLLIPILQTDMRKWPVGCTWGRLCGRSWLTWPSRVSSSVGRFQSVSGPGASLKPSSCLRSKGNVGSSSRARVRGPHWNVLLSRWGPADLRFKNKDMKGLAGQKVSFWSCSVSLAAWGTIAHSQRARRMPRP